MGHTGGRGLRTEKFSCGRGRPGGRPRTRRSAPQLSDFATLPARVQSPEARPAHISARGVEGKVLNRAGPWRISGDWWTASPWARDEWDVALSDGALYRIYFERPAGRWFVEGSYD